MTNTSISDFKQVPGIERLEASRGGIIHDKLTDRYFGRLIPKTNTYIRVFDLPAHRLVAETFIEKPVDKSRWMVNHKNGLKYDNRVENLEWVNYSENALHAYRTGLRKENVPLLTQDLETGEIKEHFSYGDCGRFLKVNPGSVHGYLNRKYNKRAFLGKYLLIRKGEEWPSITEEDLLKFKDFVSKEIFMHNRENNRCLMFSNQRLAAEFLEVSDAYINKMLKKTVLSQEKFFVYKDWEIMLDRDALGFLKDNAERIKPKGERIIISPVKRPIPVIVEDLATGEKKRYESIQEFCVLIGQKKNTVQKHILLNKGIWDKKFRITYENIAKSC
jgi:hypothetical protein